MNFAAFIDIEIPAQTTVEYYDRGAPFQTDNVVNIRPTQLGFDCDATTKPLPFVKASVAIAEEVEKDGFITASEALRVFPRDTWIGAFSLGHVKGMARTCVALSCVLHCKLTGNKVSDLFPKLYTTLQTVCAVFERHSTMTSVALRNAQLSYRGSIRRAHDAATWTGKLRMLKSKGEDGANVIKMYNAMASSGAQLQGGKRAAVLNLMMVPDQAIDAILDTVSRLTAEGAPWTDDAWANKKRRRKSCQGLNLGLLRNYGPSA